MKKKKRALLGTSVAIVILIIIALALYWQSPSTSVAQSSPHEELPGETPQDLLVVPEVPLGTITIMLACFFALIIAQMRPRTKVR